MFLPRMWRVYWETFFSSDGIQPVSYESMEVDPVSGNISNSNIIHSNPGGSEGNWDLSGNSQMATDICTDGSEFIWDVNSPNAETANIWKLYNHYMIIIKTNFVMNEWMKEDKLYLIGHDSPEFFFCCGIALVVWE